MSKTEKIARIVGRASKFRDFREGFATLLVQDSDVDIKIALGIAQSKAGELAVNMMETRYASTLMHEDRLRRAYDLELKGRATAPRTAHVTAIQRMGAALAIREFAGARNVRTELPQYAWLLKTHRETLTVIMDDCMGWLLHGCINGVHAFNVALDERRTEVTKSRRVKRAAKAA